MSKATKRHQETANPRWLALQSVLLVTSKGRSLDEALTSVLASVPLIDGRDAGLCREISSGVCRWFFALQKIVNMKLRKPFKKKDSDLEIILLIGVYQLLIMGTSPHAAVNETVKLAQRQNKIWARGLINGVLRQLIRDEINIAGLKPEDSYPVWMREVLTGDWPESVGEILHNGNQRAPMTLRVDTGQQSIDRVIKQLKSLGIEAQQHTRVFSAITLTKPHPVSAIEGFDQGRLSVQDASAQLAAGLLDCHPGMRVLDACAAPGGKTAHLLQLVPQLNLVALDKSSQRLELVIQNLNRIGFQAELKVGDAAFPEGWHEGTLFDRILADVPCSASGVIRRHPDIKILRRAGDIKQLVEQQGNILKSLWRLLKPGGMLLYSTCSIFKDENERQIEAFISNNENCAEVPLNSVQWGQLRPYGRQIFPGWQAMDGFYYARLQKLGQDTQ